MPHPLLPDLERLARLAVAAAGFELKGVHLLTHRIPMTLQVFVQRTDDTDISLDECASLSSLLGEALESVELPGDAYVLEVSSPGVDDNLHNDRDFRSFRGFPIEVLCMDERGLEVRREGLLLERDASHLHLNVRGRTQLIPRDKVIRVSLVSPAQPT
ncbi:MAG: ribosome assembly cofactor RimP [Synechococcus sp.]|nr:ribosome assembly cofactor RimP [Synechococcus sp.]